MTESIILWAQTILVSAIITLVGAAISLFFRPKIHRDPVFTLFEYLMLGTLGTVSGYAIYCTAGRSVMLGLPLLGFAWWSVKRFGFKEQPTTSEITTPRVREYVKPVMVLAVIILVLSVWASQLYRSGLGYNLLHFDEVFYSWTAAKMKYFGFETRFPLFPGSTYSNAPYHYFDLWLSSVFAETFKLDSLYAYSLNTRVFVFAQTIFGMIALARAYVKSPWIIFLSLSALLLAPVMLDYEVVRQNASILGHIKFAIVSCVYIWSFYLKKQRTEFWFFPLLILPIINIAVAPILLTALCLFFILKMLVNGSSKAAFLGLFQTVLVAMYIAAFYATGSNYESLPLSLHEKYLIYFNVDYFLHMVYGFTARYSMYTPYLIPVFLIALVSLFRKNERMWIRLKTFLDVDELLLLVLMIIVGYPIGFLFYPVAGENASQMVVITILLPMSIIIITTLLSAYNSSKRLMRRMISLHMFVIFIYSTFIFHSSREAFVKSPLELRSESYLEKLASELEHRNPEILLGGLYHCENEILPNGKASSRSELMNGYWFTPFAHLHNFMYVTSLNTDYDAYSEFDASSFDMAVEKDRHLYFWILKTKSQNLNAPFTRYWKKLKANGSTDTELNWVRRKFLLDAKVDFLVWSNDCQLPEELMNLTDTVLVDQKTGERLAFLKSDNQALN